MGFQFDIITEDIPILQALSVHYRDFPLDVTARQYCLQYCRNEMALHCNLDKKLSYPCPTVLNRHPAICFLTVYVNNVVVSCVFGQGDSVIAALDQAIAQSSKNSFSIDNARISLCFLFDEREVNVDNILLGVEAVSLRNSDKIAFFKNSVPIHRHFTLTETLEMLSIKAGLSADGYLKPETKIYTYKTLEFIEDENGVLCDWYRGNPLILISDIDKEYLNLSLHQALRLLDDVFFVGEVGQYLYDPKTKKNIDNNTLAGITRKMASLWQFSEVIHKNKLSFDRDKCKKLIQRIVMNYFVCADGVGCITVDGKTSLSANAFALLAILSFEDDFLLSEKNALLSWLISQFEVGKNPHFKLSGIEQFMYPAQCILVLMRFFEKTENIYYLSLCESLFPYYERLFYKTDKKYLMAPWFSKACFQLFSKTNNPRYAEFLFEMLDVISPLQLRSGCPQVDIMGGFALDGDVITNASLIEAFLMGYRAVQLGKREDKIVEYQKTILNGLRAILQMRYVRDNTSDENMLGGFKTSVYDGSIRIDNIQHVLPVFGAVLSFGFFEA